MDEEFIPLICPSLEIPDTWTPEMACLVADFLSHVIRAIWATHGTAMARYLERPIHPGLQPLDPNDDLPF